MLYTVINKEIAHMKVKVPAVAGASISRGILPHRKGSSVNSTQTENKFNCFNFISTLALFSSLLGFVNYFQFTF